MYKFDILKSSELFIKVSMVALFSVFVALDSTGRIFCFNIFGSRFGGTELGEENSKTFRVALFKFGFMGVEAIIASLFSLL